MWLGIDLGTSGVKAVVVDDRGTVAGQGLAPLAVSRPHPLWSEQIRKHSGAPLMRPFWRLIRRCARAIGHAGQMHGATLLDECDKPLRPAMLWNDGRSGAECAELEARCPDLHALAGNLAMPGFTPPKLMWVRAHEQEIFSRLRRVLLPKDYLRLCMTGDYASDMSDSAGTLWLDVAKRRWSETLLAACGLGVAHMPTLYEGPETAGVSRAAVASAWGMNAAPVVAGGEIAAGAVGVGVVRAGAKADDKQGYGFWETHLRGAGDHRRGLHLLLVSGGGRRALR